MADRNNTTLSEGDIPASQSSESNAPRLRRFTGITEGAAPAVPPHEHAAFSDLSAHLDNIQTAAAALKGVGAMLQPEMLAGDEQLTLTRRSDACAVFSFFGEALERSAQEASSAKERLERAAVGERV